MKVYNDYTWNVRKIKNTLYMSKSTLFGMFQAYERFLFNFLCNFWQEYKNNMEECDKVWSISSIFMRKNKNYIVTKLAWTNEKIGSDSDEVKHVN